jgi:hypothetical protein
LYRGAWYEWELHEIDMAVPLVQTSLLKRNAIFYHQSQKDRVMYQGNDSREFWVRAEDRNKHTARLYDELAYLNMKLLRLLSDLIIKKRNLKRIKIFMKYIVILC